MPVQLAIVIGIFHMGLYEGIKGMKEEQ